METCEIVTSHVALEGEDVTEHITTVCGRKAVAVVDDDGDDVTVCIDHLPAGATVVERLNQEA